MRRFRFTTNAIFYWNDKKFRVVRLLPDNKINIENISTTGLEIKSLRELVNLYVSGEIKPDGRSTIEVEKITQIDFMEWADYTEKQRADAEKRLNIILPFLEYPKYISTSVEDYVAELKETGQFNDGPLSVASVYRWLKDYFLSGHDKRSLIMDSPSRGGKGQGRFGETEDIINAVFQDMIFSRNGYSLNEVRPKLPSGKRLYIEIKQRVREENACRSENESLKAPCKRTIERRVKQLDEFDLCVAQYGLAKATAKFKQYGQLHGIEFMQRVEFDHTTLDLIAIDDEDLLPLGRPTLTKMNEFTTKTINGALISWEKSYQTVKQTLYNSILPSPNYRELYGTDNNLLVYGMFDQLIVDQGKEFIGGDLKDSCESLGINLRVSNKRDPQNKGSAESGFDVLNDLWHGLDGTTFSNVLERGDYDSVGKSALMLSEIEEVFYTYVCDIHPYEPHGFDRIIPANEWQKQIDLGYVPALPYDPSELYILLGRVAWKTLQHYGIDNNNLRYNILGHNELSKLRKKLEKRYGKGSHRKKSLKIKWHPDHMYHIHVFHPFEKKYIEVPALNQEYARKVTYWKHRVVVAEARRKEGEVNDESLAQAYRRIQNVINVARKRQKLAARTKVGRWKHKPPSAPSTPVTSDEDLPLPQTSSLLRDKAQLEIYSELDEVNIDNFDIGPDLSEL